MVMLRRKVDLYEALRIIENSFSQEEESVSSSSWDTKIESPEDLKKVLRECLEVDGNPLIIPDKCICDGHDAPFEFLWQTYTDQEKDAIVIGPRNGGKTLVSATLEFCWFSLRKVVETCHLAAILPQARRCYKYIQRWSLRNEEEINISKITREETTREEGGIIEIITGTAKGVNSPHPHKAIIDEFELMDWDIFQEALSMPKSSKGIASALILLTTRKYPSGNAQRMIDEAAQRNIRVWKWCIFEVMTRCDCQGSCPNSCDVEKQKYKTYDREGLEINWTKICKGKGKRCVGYYSFMDVVQKFLTLDWEVFDAQWLCNKPERAGVVFAEFHEDRNVLEEFTVQEIHQKLSEGWELGRGWDFGYDDPTACLIYLFKRGEELIQINEVVLSGYLIDDIADKVLLICDEIEPNKTKWTDYGDISGNQKSGIDGLSYIGKLSEKDIYVQGNYQSVSHGIDLQKRKLKKSSFTGRPTKYVTRNCQKTIIAFQSAQWERTQGTQNDFSKEKYRHDQHSHPLDADRYFTVGSMEEAISFSW